jgi:hypothetical protein
MTASCENRNEPSGCIKSGEFIDQLERIQRHNKNATSEVEFRLNNI